MGDDLSDKGFHTSISPDTALSGSRKSMVKEFFQVIKNLIDSKEELILSSEKINSFNKPFFSSDLSDSS